MRRWQPTSCGSERHRVQHPYHQEAISGHSGTADKGGGKGRHLLLALAGCWARSCHGEISVLCGGGAGRREVWQTGVMCGTNLKSTEIQKRQAA